MVLRHGRMVEYGPVKQIIEAPREDYTRQLVSVRQIQKQEAPEQSDALLRIDRVDAAYSNHFKVLHDVSLHVPRGQTVARSEEHTSELQSLMRISYAVFCLKKKTKNKKKSSNHNTRLT